ncbi:hypothetical protein [Streptosporangium sp. CA-115845]|uniref:hypothetical protein n=1 Tax=Streptosporangium sp. CA-115845 TaxID=3240071 RepID=UPI003D8E7FBC
MQAGYPAVKLVAWISPAIFNSPHSSDDKSSLESSRQALACPHAKTWPLSTV